MTAEALRARCLQKPGAEEAHPFGPFPACFRVGGRIFAQLYDAPGDGRLTLKCEPMRADLYRRRFPGAVVRGYHCPPVQQPHWNTMRLDGLEDDLLAEMIDHAYAHTVSRLTRRERAALAGETGDASCL